MTAPSGLARSVHVRLVRHAKEIGVDPNLVLTRFATERFLYRLSCSRHADRFVLKGALLLLVWLGETIRPTRDADLLGIGDLSDDSLAAIFREVCTVEVEADAVTYLPESIAINAIRAEDPYGGRRVRLQARLGPARILLQVDVGIGDAVTPEPEWLDYPSLLGFPAARLLAYRPETTIAEKLHAMVVLGSKNSRLRDYFDLHALAERVPFTGQPLTHAVRATFERRRTPIPVGLPFGLTPEFPAVGGKRAQWSGFLKKNRLTSATEDLAEVVQRIALFLGPVIDAASRDSDFIARWPPGGPWQLGEAQHS